MKKKAKVNNMKMVPMFTYGILRYPENIEADGGINIVTDARAFGFRLYAQAGRGISLATAFEAFAYEAVVGTYFEVPESVVLGDYDFIEGYNPDGPKIQNMYNRELINVTFPDGDIRKAFMYVANISWFAKDFVPRFQIKSGNSGDKWKLATKL